MKRFTIYDDEVKSILGLIKKLGKTTNEVIDSLEGKTDNKGDHKGSWQGLNRPTLSEEGMRAQVEKNMNIITQITERKNSLFKYILKTKYGILGDGITDDTISIQNAIDDIVKNGGSELYLPSGTYLVNGELKIRNKSFSLIGDYSPSTNGQTNLIDNIGTVILCGEGSDNVLTIENDNLFENVSSFIIEKIAFLGINNKVNKRCINISNKSMTFVIRDCSIQGFAEQGIKINYCFDGVLDNVRLQYCGTENTYSALEFDILSSITGTTNNIKIINLHIENCDYVVKMANCHNITFINCKFEKGNWKYPHSPMWKFYKSQVINFVNCYFLTYDVDDKIADGTFGSNADVPYYMDMNSDCQNIKFNNCDFLTYNRKGGKWIKTTGDCTEINLYNSKIVCSTLDNSLIIPKHSALNSNTIFVPKSSHSEIKRGISLIGSRINAIGNLFLPDNANATPTEYYPFELGESSFNIIKDNNLSNLYYTNIVKTTNQEYVLNSKIDSWNATIENVSSVDVNVLGIKGFNFSGTELQHLKYGQPNQSIMIFANTRFTIKSLSDGSIGRVITPTNSDVVVEQYKTVMLRTINGTTWFIV